MKELFTALVCIVVGVLPLPAQQQRIVIGPTEAIRLAAADISGVAPEDQPFVRYAYFQEQSPIAVGAFAYAINTALSRGGNVHRPTVLADGHLVRFDLRRLAPQKDAFVRLFDIWENRLALTEPYTHKQNVVRNKAGQFFLKVFFDDAGQRLPSYTANDGKVYSYKTVPIERQEQFALHTGPESMLLLHGLTDSNMPIVYSEWLQNVILTTLKVGLTNGVYYDVMGVKGKNQKEILAIFGADEKDSENLRGDSRAALLRSGVTDRERRIDVFFGRGVRPTAGLPFITLTHDIALADTDVEQDPFQNILEFKDSAREMILVLPNGMLGGFLFNGRGELQEFVPDQVAHEKVPGPSPQTLVPMISCIACHLPQDGFLEFRNDIRDLYFQRLPEGRKIDIFDDLSSRKGTFDTLDLAASKYGGDLMPPLRIAQAFHGAACQDLTGFPAKEIGAELTRSRNEFVYGGIGSFQALKEIGRYVEPKGKDEAEKAAYMAARLAEIVPPKPVDPRLGFSPEHPSIAPLRSPIPKTINRAKWERIIPDFALAAMEAELKKLENEVKQ